MQGEAEALVLTPCDLELVPSSLSLRFWHLCEGNGLISTGNKVKAGTRGVSSVPIPKDSTLLGPKGLGAH